MDIGVVQIVKELINVMHRMSLIQIISNHLSNMCIVHG